MSPTSPTAAQGIDNEVGEELRKEERKWGVEEVRSRHTAENREVQQKKFKKSNLSEVAEDPKHATPTAGRFEESIVAHYDNGDFDHNGEENEELAYDVTDYSMVEEENTTERSLVKVEASRANTSWRESKQPRKTCTYCDKEISSTNFSRHMKVKHPEMV